MRNIWLKEPLLWFALAGVSLFLVAPYINPLAPADVNQHIEITPSLMQRLADQWQAQMGRTPSQAELDGLIEQWVHEEIYYREGLKLGLAENDTIIRRRLVQKLTFLTEDLATASPPDDAMLEDFYQNHPDQYTQPERFSFRHRFFSKERRVDAKKDATVALEGASEEEGDPFMLQRSYAERSLRQVAQLFGSEFAAQLGTLEADSWQGPIQSAFGWHLVEITQRLPSTLSPFGDVKQRVTADLISQRREEANSAYYESLRAAYTVASPTP